MILKLKNGYKVQIQDNVKNIEEVKKQIALIVDAMEDAKINDIPSDMPHFENVLKGGNKKEFSNITESIKKEPHTGLGWLNDWIEDLDKLLEEKKPELFRTINKDDIYNTKLQLEGLIEEVNKRKEGWEKDWGTKIVRDWKHSLEDVVDNFNKLCERIPGFVPYKISFKSNEKVLIGKDAIELSASPISGINIRNAQKGSTFKGRLPGFENKDIEFRKGVYEDIINEMDLDIQNKDKDKYAEKLSPILLKMEYEIYRDGLNFLEKETDEAFNELKEKAKGKLEQIANIYSIKAASKEQEPKKEPDKEPDKENKKPEIKEKEKDIVVEKPEESSKKIRQKIVKEGSKGVSKQEQKVVEKKKENNTSEIKNEEENISIKDFLNKEITELSRLIINLEHEDSKGYNPQKYYEQVNNKMADLAKKIIEELKLHNNPERPLFKTSMMNEEDFNYLKETFFPNLFELIDDLKKEESEYLKFKNFLNKSMELKGSGYRSLLGLKNSLLKRDEKTGNFRITLP